MIHDLILQAFTSLACVGMMAGGAILVVILFAVLRSAAQESAAYARAARRQLGFEEDER